MAYGFGTTVNPQLGATNYSGFLQGALSGAQMQAQGGAAIAQGLEAGLTRAGEGVKKYLENKETKALFESSLPNITKKLQENQFLRERLNITDPTDKGQIETAVKIFGDGNRRKGLMYVNQLLAEEAQAGRESAAMTGALTRRTAASRGTFEELMASGMQAGDMVDRSPTEVLAEYSRLGGRNPQVAASLAGTRQSERALTSAEGRADRELRQQEAAARATGERQERQMRLEAEKAAEQVRQFNAELNRKIKEAQDNNYKAGKKDTIDVNGKVVEIEYTGSAWVRESDKQPLVVNVDMFGGRAGPNPLIFGQTGGGSFADQLDGSGGSIADRIGALPPGWGSKK
jgi:predicted transglutaminase-like cysteine proteinase